MNVLIISSSPRKGGNSDILCDRFAAGASEAGHKVEKIRIADCKIVYCTGCYVCQKTKKCVQNDDAASVLNKMLAADFIVLATPVYFYCMSAQLKALIDRSVVIFPNLVNKKFFYIMTMADTNKKMFAGTIAGLNGFLDCYEGSVLTGMIEATGVYEKGSVNDTSFCDKAYKAGLKLK